MRLEADEVVGVHRVVRVDEDVGGVAGEEGVEERRERVVGEGVGGVEGDGGAGGEGRRADVEK